MALLNLEGTAANATHKLVRFIPNTPDKFFRIALYTSGTFASAVLDFHVSFDDGVTIIPISTDNTFSSARHVTTSNVTVTSMIASGCFYWQGLPPVEQNDVLGKPWFCVRVINATSTTNVQLRYITP